MTKENLYQTLIEVFLFLILTHSCISEKREIVRDKNGNIVLKCELKNGVRHGKCFEYYPCGTVIRVSSWVAGLMDGEMIEYFENGQKKTVSMWKNDKVNGENIEYFECGKIKETSMWENGKLNGEHVIYFENGGIKVRSFYINDNRTEVQFYDDENRLLEVYYFMNVNHESILNAAVFYDNDNERDYPNNINLDKTVYAEIFSYQDTIEYGGFAEYELNWICGKGYYVGAVTGNIDHNFNVVDTTSLIELDFNSKNKFYPSNMETDTLRVIFEFMKIEKGERHIFTTYLEKVFKIISKDD